MQASFGPLTEHPYLLVFAVVVALAIQIGRDCPRLARTHA
jgi:hypothetical protein